MYKRFFKRLFDVISSFFAIVLLLPIIGLAALLIRLKLGSPILFKQLRPGKDGKLFTIYKFRTMTNKRDENGDLLPDSVRLTKFGRFIRSTSIDELPELFNILKGDMSVVGPRPLLAQYLALYNEHQSRRHELRPGLTGFAAVNGRNNLIWEKKFDYDVFYVDNVSFWLDMKIIWTTVIKVIKRSGICEEGSATMATFKGNTQKSLDIEDSKNETESEILFSIREEITA